MSEAVFNSGTDEAWSGTFDKSVARHSTTRIDEVIPLLEKAERAALAGAWVVVMISYEAAPAFDRALLTHEPDDFPLVWVAIYPRPSKLDNLLTTHGEHLELWQPQISRQQFQSAVERIQKLIAAGDTYQVNYTFPLTTTFHGEIMNRYRQLCDAQPAPYCSYLDLDRYKILSLSPELFFERKGNRITTRPMKGTIRRGRWSAEDQELAAQLHASEKDRAENVMIVDLLRNDLGRIAIPGSVEVSDLFQLERYPTLWQMTSTVSAEIAPQTRLAQIMSALFPCGSITGAPKIRTMEIIRELEPSLRHTYTGAIGVMQPGGDCIFNVAIRTLILDTQTGEVTLNVGSGVTHGSKADNEYDECILKSAFLKTPHRSFSLLESILLEDGQLFLLDRHISRLKSSAAFFDFQLDEQRIRNELSKASLDYPVGNWKVRLIADSNGELTITVNKLENWDLPVRIQIAERPVSSTNTFLFHKTTERSVYDQAIRLANCDDVVLWNERGEITESTVANIVISADDQLWTPPIASGLLPGVFREELLADGRIHERVITVEEFRTAKQIFLINSVRRWMPAVLEAQRKGGVNIQVAGKRQG